MIIWERLSVDGLCGRCGELQRAGEPVQRIQLVGMKRRLIRCTKCVGDAPPDLPAFTIPQRRTKPMQSITHMATSMRARLPYKERD